MKRIEENINTRVRELMTKKVNSHKKWSDRDQVETRYYEDEDLYIIKYYLWDNCVMQYHKTKDCEYLYLSYCGYDTQTTRQRLRAFEDIFNYSIVNVGRYKYSIIYDNKELPIDYTSVYCIDLKEKTISIK